MAKKVVIIGGGFGGLNAARGLRGADVEITLIDRSNHHLFQPLLYQVATAGLSPADISMPIRSVLRQQSNVDVLMAEAREIDVKRQQVITDRGEVPYDFLVIATGARHSYFGHPEWERCAPGLKSIEDATKIRRQILLAFEMAEMESDAAKRQAHLTFLIVGAGPTGVELAGAIAELSHKALTADFRHIRPEAAHILLIEAGPRILASFPEALSARAAQDLQQLGVDIRCGTRVEHVDEEGAQVAGERIAARTIIWAAGVVASAPTGSWLSGAGELGVKTDNVGRVVVNADLTVPGDKNVFVIGDAARFEIGDGKILPGVCPVAMQQGSYVANVIRQRLKSNSSGTLPAAFRYINKGNLATIGRSSAIADFGKFHFTGVVAWFLWLSVHIYFLIGFRNRLLVLIQWAWAYLTFQRGARLITPVVAKPMDLP